MAVTEIDRLIQLVNTNPYGPVNELIAIGEPALCRLLEAMNGTILIPLDERPIDAMMNRQMALGRLASEWPEKVISLIQGGKVKLTLAIIMGLARSSDPRLKEIAREC